MHNRTEGHERAEAAMFVYAARHHGRCMWCKSTLDDCQDKTAHNSRLEILETLMSRELYEGWIRDFAAEEPIDLEAERGARRLAKILEQMGLAKPKDTPIH